MNDESELCYISCKTESNKICPISQRACPGVCMFRSIMHTNSLGIIILDRVVKQVMFQNDYSLELIGGIVASGDYEGIKDKFCPGLSEDHKSRYPETSKSIRVDSKTIGYSVHRESGRYAWIMLRDITREEHMESVAEALTVVSNIGYIFSGVRHEIGNPLNNIKMTLSVLREKLDDFPRDKIIHYIDRSLGEINRIEYLLNLLKTYNLYEKTAIQDVDLAVFLYKFQSLAGTDMEKSGVVLELKLQGDNLIASADPRALHQVLLNLVTNASEALHCVLNPRIVISACRDGNHITITVEDNGHGMSEEQLKGLFKPFVTHKRKGTGLGLVFSRKMLAKMDGSIEAKSEEGVGTTMAITLPVAESIMDTKYRTIC